MYFEYSFWVRGICIFCSFVACYSSVLLCMGSTGRTLVCCFLPAPSLLPGHAAVLVSVVASRQCPRGRLPFRRSGHFRRGCRCQSRHCRQSRGRRCRHRRRHQCRTGRLCRPLVANVIVNVVIVVKFRCRRNRTFVIVVECFFFFFGRQGRGCKKYREGRLTIYSKEWSAYFRVMICFTNPDPAEPNQPTSSRTQGGAHATLEVALSFLFFSCCFFLLEKLYPIQNLILEKFKSALR